MPQIAMFPLSDAELKAKAKELAAKIGQHEALLEEKADAMQAYKERLRQLAGEIRRLAKTIETEKEERQATDEEAPWQGLIDEAEAKVGRGRRRTRRDVDGEVFEAEDEP
jgi:uncharacterized coiled-coil DUF342 family protein